MSDASILIKVTDPKLRAYMQQYPFLTGPDEALNLRSFEAVKENIHIKIDEELAGIYQMPHKEFDMDASISAAALEILNSVGLSKSAAKNAEHDFAWRIWGLPYEATSILCIGIGEGHELAFLKAKAPKAKIVAIEYIDKVLPGLLDLTGTEMRCGDMVSLLSSATEKFDVIFSNHTLEHLYDPEVVINLMIKRLSSNGVFIAGMPLDGQKNGILYHDVLEICKTPKNLHLLDMGLLDAGHPWKTNSNGLTVCLMRAGLRDVKIYQRQDVPNRTKRGIRSPNNFNAIFHEGIYKLIFGTYKMVMKMIWPKNSPLSIRKIQFAIERRLPFGANRLRGRCAPDIVVVGKITI